MSNLFCGWNMRNFHLYLLLIGGINSNILLAQSVSSGALFLDLPQNAHQHSLGASASLLGLDGININPASTTHPQNSSQYYIESALNISRLPGDALFSNLSFLHWFGDRYGTLSGSASFLHYGGISITDQNGIAAGQANAYDLSVSLNYSRKIFYDILVGVNATMIQQKLHTFSGMGFSADFGLKKRFRIKKNELWVSLAGNHFGPGITFDQVKTPLPSKINAAVSFALRQWLPSWFSMEMGPQFGYFLEGHYNLNWGSEFLFHIDSFDIYALNRYQYNSIGRQNGFSFGVGGSYRFQAYRMHISFAINPFAAVSDFVSSMKLVYNFGTSKLSQVRPVDFSGELDYDEPQELAKDSDEIIIQLDEPVFTTEEE